VSRPRRSGWSSVPPLPIPKHPIRDAAILYGVFAVIIVVIAWLSGTSVPRAIILAARVFVVAMGWSTLSWRRRLRDVRREEFEA
jgi:hypothetical protein